MCHEEYMYFLSLSLFLSWALSHSVDASFELDLFMVMDMNFVNRQRGLPVTGSDMGMFTRGGSRGGGGLTPEKQAEDAGEQAETAGLSTEDGGED